jgi:hypothetical protein
MEDSHDITSEFLKPLRNRDDWEQWNTQFLAIIKDYGIQKLVLGDEIPLSPPVAPLISSYLTQGVTTRAGSTTEAESQTTVASDIPVTTKSLTSENQRIYQFDFQVYTHFEKRFKDQQNALARVNAWIRKTISAHFLKITLDPNDSLKQWYKKIKDHVAYDEFRTQETTLKQYALAIKPLTNLRNAEKWLASWEEAMDLAYKSNLPVATTPAQWLLEFRQAVKPVMPGWAENARMIMTPLARDGTLTYRNLARDFREALESVTIPNRKVVKGSFVSYGEPAQQGEEEDKPHEEQVSRSAKRRSAKRKQSESFSELICRACGGRHTFRRCFYLFEGIAPADWMQRQDIRKIVDDALKSDHSLRKEVERLKKQFEKEKEKVAVATRKEDKDDQD